MYDTETLLKYLWIGLASMAGAITALAFKQFQPLTPRERMMLVFVGFVFAIFVGPLIVGWVLPDEKASSRTVGAMYYMIAAGSNWILPWAIEKLTGFRANRDTGILEDSPVPTLIIPKDVLK